MDRLRASHTARHCHTSDAPVNLGKSGKVALLLTALLHRLPNSDQELRLDLWVVSFVSFGTNLAQSASPVRSVGRWAEVGGVCSEACVLRLLLLLNLARFKTDLVEGEGAPAIGQRDLQNCPLRERWIQGEGEQALREWKCRGPRRTEQQGQEDVPQRPSLTPGIRDPDFH